MRQTTEREAHEAPPALLLRQHKEMFDQDLFCDLLQATAATKSGALLACE